MTTDEARTRITDALTALCFRAKVQPDDTGSTAAQAVRATVQRDRATGDCEPWNNWFRAATGLGDRLQVSREKVLYLYRDEERATRAVTVPLPPVIAAAIALGVLVVPQREAA